MVKKWVKWAAGAVMVGAIGYGVNHYTGDKLGLEKLVTGKSSYAAESAGANPQAKGSGRLDSKIHDSYWLKAELLKQKLYLVWFERDDKKGLYPAAAKLTEPVVTDNTYTAVEKYYRVTFDEAYNVKVTEFDEVFLKELNEGKIRIATGYVTAPSAKTQTSGPSTAQSLQRILR
jgi:hypothetical protein